MEVHAIDTFAISPIVGIARLGIIPDDAVDEPEIRIPLLGHGCTLLFMMTAMPQAVRNPENQAPSPPPTIIARTKYPSAAHPGFIRRPASAGTSEIGRAHV